MGGVYGLFVYNMEYENRNYQKPGKYTGIIHAMNSRIQVVGNGEWNNGGEVLAGEERGKSIQKKSELETNNTKVG